MDNALEEDDLYDLKEQALKREIQQQEYAVYEASFALGLEVKKLITLQEKLRWLHMETQST